MQTEMPLEIHHHITHDDNSPHPIPSYSGRALYEDEVCLHIYTHTDT
jgi:hypothetical protein